MIRAYVKDTSGKDIADGGPGTEKKLQSKMHEQSALQMLFVSVQKVLKFTETN